MAIERCKTPSFDDYLILQKSIYLNNWEKFFFFFSRQRIISIIYMLISIYIWKSIQHLFVFLKFRIGFHLYGQEIDFELEKLRIELRHVRGMYAIAQSETIGASRKVNYGFLLFTKDPFSCCFSLHLSWLHVR